ncbi:MAG: YheT family hydrolase [Candidatus Berkiellales bacterium]
MTELLAKLGLPPFNPLPGLASGHSQTLASYLFPYNPFLSDKTQHIITLADGDKIVLIENRPLLWRPSQRIILMLHGLTGNHQSKYLVRITQKLVALGFLVMRLDMRGCGAGAGLAKHLYHSGRSEDPRTILGWLKTRFPNSPVTQIGFSLGGNVTLKMAGEDSARPSGNLDSIVAVSPPLDLYASVSMIIQEQNKVFDQHFIKTLLNDVNITHRAFPELPKPQFPPKLNTFLFDELYTAPYNNFKNAMDYYTQSSSSQFLHSITLPTFILHAKDDPLVSQNTFMRLPKRDGLELLLTEHGGHVAWLGFTGKRFEYRWMDRVIVEWIKLIDQENTSYRPSDNVG